ncbi:MAG: capsular polysaccharide biosynthesis protein [Lachnospiraceae bacterium]|nr:capsular polysaccharide biosynthesis protein [Lachnospiraceae bacterium]
MAKGKEQPTAVSAAAEPYDLLGKQEEGEKEIDLIEIFYLLWDHIFEIILCMVIGAAVAYLYTYFLVTPQYTATSKMYVVSASRDSVLNLSDLQIGSQLTSDYQELIKSRPVMEDCIRELDLKMTPAQLSSKISISNPSSTRVLKITVVTEDPVKSRDIANKIADLSVVYLPKIIESDAPNIYERATEPTNPSSPSYKRNVAIGALLGILLICAFICIRYWMNDTFQSGEDVQKYLGIEPLAVIPEAGSGKKKHYGYYGYGAKKSSSTSAKSAGTKTTSASAKSGSGTSKRQ